MSSLVINNVQISTDQHGRFSLNDLHKAVGSSVSALPNKFLRQDSVKKVISVLNAQNRAFKAIDIKRGRYTGGTWVSKELVYKYAMWVDAEFEVKVIQTFDAINGSGKAISSMQAINDLVRKIESDKEIASFCGAELAKYRKVKKQNANELDAEVERIQLKLGFKASN
jgi:hypothetical protein